MRQFDVHLPDGGGPLLLVLQAEAVSPFSIVVAAPLYAADDWHDPVRHLQPRLAIDGQDFILATNYLAAVPRSQFGAVLTSLEQHRATILAALDFLYTGI
jgi:toxin CcdB